MKLLNKEFFRWCLPLFLLVIAAGFSPSQVTDKAIATALKKGDATLLASYFANNINLTVESQSGTYSNRQAKVILHKFFIDYPPASFSTSNSGTIADGNSYLLGTYFTTKGNSFSVYVLWLNKPGNYKITQLTIIKN